jgi:DNA-binding protein HU-beta
LVQSSSENDTFEVRERPAHKGRNPRTGEELQIAASKIPVFKPGASLKAAVKGERQ